MVKSLRLNILFRLAFFFFLFFGFMKNDDDDDVVILANIIKKKTLCYRCWEHSSSQDSEGLEVSAGKTESK